MFTNIFNNICGKSKIEENTNKSAYIKKYLDLKNTKYDVNTILNR